MTRSRDVALELLTWNLGANSKTKTDSKRAFDIACRYVSSVRMRGRPIVAAFQECPAAEDEIGGRPPGIHVFEKPHDGRTKHPMVLLSSTPLGDRQHWERMQVARIDLGGRSLTVGGYHGLDRLHHNDDAARGGVASELRWRFDAYASDGEAVLLGDFNAEAGDSEIEHDWCFGVRGDAGGRTMSHGRPRQTLRIVPATGPSGSHWLRRAGRGARWALIDHLVASAPLAEVLQSEISTRLLEEELTDELGRPNVSDHLPVVGKLLGGVKR